MMMMIILISSFRSSLLTSLMLAAACVAATSDGLSEELVNSSRCRWAGNNAYKQRTDVMVQSLSE